ncbi:MAG: hypothetical protein JNN27_09640 [Planctomycetes bacterium]|nr:hypothetical protein [Planctomycetota bacterium]
MPSTLSTWIVWGDERRVVVLDDTAAVRNNSHAEFHAVTLRLVARLHTECGLDANARQDCLAHNRPVESRLSELLLEPTDRQTRRKVQWFVPRRRGSA